MPVKCYIHRIQSQGNIVYIISQTDKNIILVFGEVKSYDKIYFFGGFY